MIALISDPSWKRILSSVKFVEDLFIENGKILSSSLSRILKSFIFIPIKSLVTKNSLLFVYKFIFPTHSAFPIILLVKLLPNNSLINSSPI